MASDTTLLTLDDILLPLDPTLEPAPPPLTPSAPQPISDNTPPKSPSPTPEPLDEQEMFDMRTKALELRDAFAKGKGKEDAREYELVDMVLRLTATLPTRSQIIEQAMTILRLSQQQDFLVKRMIDERDMWDAERDSIYRVSEALMAQANMASANTYKEQEASKKPAAIESENVSLRRKVGVSMCLCVLFY
ncbi:hypothetical protein DFH11DRAFT_1518230 [Phellopilus nigrolimitatus]|nr:hypothetical protein DFH11DRAFT_1518230 [Phellopilus nigrolimitatus]